MVLFIHGFTILIIEQYIDIVYNTDSTDNVNQDIQDRDTSCSWSTVVKPSKTK